MEVHPTRHPASSSVDDDELIAVTLTRAEWRAVQGALDEYYVVEHSDAGGLRKSTKERNAARRDWLLATLPRLDVAIYERAGVARSSASASSGTYSRSRELETARPANAPTPDATSADRYGAGVLMVRSAHVTGNDSFVEAQEPTTRNGRANPKNADSAAPMRGAAQPLASVRRRDMR